jgi:hypothetical protein
MGAMRRPWQSRWFGNHHSNCVNTHDAHCTTTCLQHGKSSLQCFICQKAHYDMMYQRRVETYPLAEPHDRRIGPGHIIY